MEEISAKSSFSSSCILKVTSEVSTQKIYLGEKRRHKTLRGTLKRAQRRSVYHINTHTDVLLKENGLVRLETDGIVDRID